MGVPLFWAVVFGFLAGVFLRSFFPLGVYATSFALLIASALFAFAWLNRKELMIVAGIFVLALGVGAMRMQSAVLAGEPVLDALLGERIVLEGVVFEESDARETSERLFVRIEYLITSDATTSVSAGALVVAPRHSGIRYGDRVRAEGELQLPESFDAGVGREFNYPAFLAKDGIGYALSFAEVEKIGEGTRNPLKATAIWIKQTYLEGLALALPEPYAGLAGGITAGDKRGLGAELSETFRIVGLIHIVVLSGYNIMVVISFIERVFGWTRLWVRSAASVCVAVFFALITGLASSSVRAASMAVIATIGKTTGRTYLASRALGLVAFLMVLWNPWLLVFDIGFQLSIIATVGLIFISPLFAERLTWFTEKFGLREIAAATLGTQVAVLPLLLYQSGSLSLYSLPANLLALIVVPYAMLLSFIAGVLGLITGPLAPLVGFPAYVLLWYITNVAEFFAWLPFASLAIPVFSASVMFFIYVAGIGALYMSQKERRSP